MIIGKLLLTCWPDRNCAKVTQSSNGVTNSESWGTFIGPNGDLLPYRLPCSLERGVAVQKSVTPPFPGTPQYLGTIYNLLAYLVAQIQNPHPGGIDNGGDGMG
jgi:hypothetical protein